MIRVTYMDGSIVEYPCLQSVADSVKGMYIKKYRELAATIARDGKARVNLNDFTKAKLTMDYQIILQDVIIEEITK